MEASHSDEAARLRLRVDAMEHELRAVRKERDTLAARVRRLKREQWRNALFQEWMEDLMWDPWACYMIRHTTIPVGKLAARFRCSLQVIQVIRLMRSWWEVRPCTACAKPYLVGSDADWLRRRTRTGSRHGLLWARGGDREFCIPCKRDNKRRPGWKVIFFAWCHLRKYLRPAVKHVREYTSKNYDTIKGWFEATQETLGEWERIEALAGHPVLLPPKTQDPHLLEIAAVIGGNLQGSTSQPRR